MAKNNGGAFALAQRFGRSLMLPIATLPAAGILLRIGQADVLGKDGVASVAPWMQPVADVLAAAGGAIFGALPMLFAVGIAVGMARRADGSTGLAAVFGYLVFEGVNKAMSPLVMGVNEAGEANKMVNYGVLGGILVGLIAASLWQKFYRVKLPDWLAFFGGRRFVPMVVSVATMGLSIVMSLLFPAFDWLINKQLGGWLMHAGSDSASAASKALVGFVFGTVNRLLIPFGLHHLWNAGPWFQLGECQNAAGETLHGDLNCFLAGTLETNSWTGNFTSGFFPIMMFALPAAAIAMAHVAHKTKREATMALMVSVALTAFLTGITEPLEFAFAYVAFPLYAVHAVLTGTSLAVTNVLGAKDSFSFSAGLIDYVLNFTKSAAISGGYFQGPIMLIILGLIFAAIYYFVFRFMITKFDYKTPGREEDDSDAFAAAQATAAEATGKNAELRRQA